MSLPTLPPFEGYEHRLVAFIDILGFKSLIARVESGDPASPALFETLQSVLRFMDAEARGDSYRTDLPVSHVEGDHVVERELGDPRMLYVSDSLVISTTADANGLTALGNKVAKISTDLAWDGVFVRGAITRGPMFHHGPLLFGSAYQDACALEGEASVPRVIFSDDVVEAFGAGEGAFPLRPPTARRDEDGRWFLSPFPWEYYPPYASDWVTYLIRVKLRILEDLNAIRVMTCTTPGEVGQRSSLLTKYQWLARELNFVVDTYQARSDSGLHGQLSHIVGDEAHGWRSERPDGHQP